MRPPWLCFALPRMGPLFLAALLAAPAGEAQQSQHTYRIAGVVVDAATGAPVPHATVSVFQDAEETQSVSGEDGRFVFSALAAAKYPLSATARGYVHEGYQQHGAYTTGIAVGNGLDSEHLVFRLHRQAVITGRVTDEYGEPLRQAQIILLGFENGTGSRAPSERARTLTNDLGEYRFPHLLPGKYYVAVTARPWYAQTELNGAANPAGSGSFANGPGSKLEANPLLDVVYPVTFSPNAAERRTAEELILAAGETKEADIHVQAVPAIHLRLTNLPADENVQINFSASESLFGSLDEPVNIVSGQISPGEYEVAGLPPGDVALVVMQSGSQGTTSRTIKTNLRASDSLDVAGKGATANVTGRVILLDSDENPEQGQVSLRNENNQNASTSLQKDGTFSLSAMQSDTYKVFVSFPDGDEYIEKLSATGAATHGREVTIAGAGDVQLLITAGQAAGEVTGVAKLDGKPTAGVLVLLVPETGENLEENSRLDQSDSDGTFSLSEIPPGKYRLMAIADAWDLDRTNWNVLKPYLEKGQPLGFSGTEKRTVVVEVQHAVK
jgi:carboxypeptidase family protein